MLNFAEGIFPTCKKPPIMLPQQVFNIEKTGDNKSRFVKDNITITTEDITFIDGKHYINKPENAFAQFLCFGNIYVVRNISKYLTVEGWYHDEIFPKFQMLLLLENPLLA